jgi:hypothetical protein
MEYGIENPGGKDLNLHSIEIANPCFGKHSSKLSANVLSLALGASVYQLALASGVAE